MINSATAGWRSSAMCRPNWPNGPPFRAPQPQTTKGERQSCGTTGNLITEVLKHAQGLAHDSPRTPNVHISRPRRLKHHQKRTPRERKKKDNCGGRREKRAKFWASHPSGLHPSAFGAPLFPGLGWASTLPPFGPLSRFGPLPSGPPFGGPTLCGPKIGHGRLWPKPTLAKTDFGQNEFGQNRLWPKRV